MAEVLLAPLDAARRAALRSLGKTGGLLARDRELRLTVLSVWVVLSALALALVVPALSLALGPVLLGVPHLFADVRYLVARTGFARRRALVLMVGPPIIGAAVTGHALFAGLALAGAALAARATWPRRLALAGVGVALALVGARFVWQADLGLAHAHNVVAVLALSLYPRPPEVSARPTWALLVCFVVASLAVLVAPAPPALGFGGDLPGLVEHAAVLAPGIEPALGARVVVLFALAQTVHYGVWLRLVPEQARDRRAPRTFVSSYRALRDELGAPLVVGALALSALVLAWSLADLRAARDGYLRAASFHGALELAALGVLALEARPSRRRGGGSPP